MNNKKRNVLITGAAGLLGSQHAAALIEKNFNVILIDKNLESLKKVKKKLKSKYPKAEIIISFGADFLGNWGSTDYATQYTEGRNPKSGKMSKHYQIESTLTLSISISSLLMKFSKTFRIISSDSDWLAIITPT